MAGMEIRLLTAADAALLDRVAPDVFDEPLQPALVAEFLADDRHHLVVAVDDGVVIGFASAVHYVHPDKPAELWINEVGVTPEHHRRGVGTAIISALLEHGRRLGCGEAWVLTERHNEAAMRLYASTGGTEAPPETVMFNYEL
jgi:GNAT superfamily N-acetyltransferase